MLYHFFMPKGFQVTYGKIVEGAEPPLEIKAFCSPSCVISTINQLLGFIACLDEWKSNETCCCVMISILLAPAAAAVVVVIDRTVFPETKIPCRKPGERRASGAESLQILDSVRQVSLSKIRVWMMVLASLCE